MPTMITSRSDSIASRRACANHDKRPDQTPSIPAEHPCANHDNVQIRLHPFPAEHVPTMTTSRSDSIHSRRASMCHNAVVLRSIFLLQHGHKCYSIPRNTGFFETVTLPNMLKTLKANTAVISTIFLLQRHGHNAISIPQNTGCSYPLASAPCARERDDGA